MTVSDATRTALECRCYMDEVVFEIEVALCETHQRLTYHAVAFVAAHDGRARAPVVNDRGMPLVAIGHSPEKAALFMSSALRRKHRRGETRSPGAAGRQSVSVAVAVGSE